MHYLVAYDVYDNDFLVDRVRFFSESVFHVRSTDITSAIRTAYTLLWNIHKGKDIIVVGILLEEEDLDADIQEDIESGLYLFADLPSCEGLL